MTAWAQGQGRWGQGTGAGTAELGLNKFWIKVMVLGHQRPKLNMLILAVGCRGWREPG